MKGVSGGRPVMIVFRCDGSRSSYWPRVLNDDAAGSGLTQLGGYIGPLTAIAAFSASARTIINGAFNREVLPG